MALTDKLTAIADAIREKTGSTDVMTLDEMAEGITGLDTSGFSGVIKVVTSEPSSIHIIEEAAKPIINDTLTVSSSVSYEQDA